MEATGRPQLAHAHGKPTATTNRNKAKHKAAMSLKVLWTSESEESTAKLMKLASRFRERLSKNLDNKAPTTKRTTP